MANVILTITESSHPDYHLFATFTLKGKQFAKRGNRVEINHWVNAITMAAHEQFGTVFDIQDNA